MTDNREQQARLYLPGSRVDGLTLSQARAELNRAPIWNEPDRGAGDQGERLRRNRAVRAAGNSPRNLSRGASGQKRQKRNLVSAFVSVRIIQLLAVLAAIVVFYVAFRLGWL